MVASLMTPASSAERGAMAALGHLRAERAAGEGLLRDVRRVVGDAVQVETLQEY